MTVSGLVHGTALEMNFFKPQGTYTRDKSHDSCRPRKPLPFWEDVPGYPMRQAPVPDA